MARKETASLAALTAQVTALTDIVASLAAETYSAPVAAAPVAPATRKPRKTAPASKTAGKVRQYRFSPAYPGMPLHRGKPVIGGTFTATSSGNRFRVIGVENGRVSAERI